MKSVKVMLIGLVALIAVCVVCVTVFPRESSADNVMRYSSIVFETVAHIPETEFPEYTQVWSDTNTDRAVYIKNNYEPAQIVIEGDRVSFNNIEAEVISTDLQGFEISLGENQLAEYGMSGSIVEFNGTPIALVSRATSVSTIYCVYY